MNYKIIKNESVFVGHIKWERIFLHIFIETENGGSPEFFLVNRWLNNDSDKHEKKQFENAERIKLENVEHQENGFHITINMAAVKGRSFLSNGNWRIVAKYGETLHFAVPTADLGRQLPDFDKVFRYGRRKYAYTVTFTIVEKDGYVDFAISSMFMKLNEKWQKRNRIWEAKTISGKIRNTRKTLVLKGLRRFYVAVSAFRKKGGNNVLFMSETKSYLSGNLKYIHDRMLERNLEKEYNITVSCRRAVGQNSSNLSWMSQVKMIASNDIIFIDDNAPVLGQIHPLKNAKLVQVWHAGEGFKSVGYSRFGGNGSPFPTGTCHKTYDYAVTGSERLIDVYSEVFGIEREAFIASGMPRLDGFMDESRIADFKEGFYKDYPEFRNRKIILFAPTFRGKNQKEANYDFSKIDLEQIHDFCGDEYLFMIKMHPFIREKINIKEEYRDRIVDFSDYQDINSLYYVTEIMITDYSSSFYEFALMNRPILFYTYDRKSYEAIRGVHKPVKETAPGKVCDTFEDLMEALRNRDYDFDKTEQFRKANFENYTGNACDKVIDRVLFGKK